MYLVNFKLLKTTELTIDHLEMKFSFGGHQIMQQ
jgi:hypothetical protein